MSVYSNESEPIPLQELLVKEQMLIAIKAIHILNKTEQDVIISTLAGEKLDEYCIRTKQCHPTIRKRYEKAIVKLKKIIRCYNLPYTYIGKAK